MNRVPIRILFAVFILMLAIGCSRVRASSISYDASKLPPKQQDYAMEFIDKGDITRPYQVIGLVQAEGLIDAEMEAMFEAIRQEARKLGADAVTELEYKSVTHGPPHLWVGKAIVWKRD